MSVKLKTSMFRDLLYLHEVIIHKQINAAAIKNGIRHRLKSLLKSKTKRTPMLLPIILEI